MSDFTKEQIIKFDKLAYEYKLTQKLKSQFKKDQKKKKKEILEAMEHDYEVETENVKIKHSSYSRVFFTEKKIKKAFSDVLSEDEIDALLEQVEGTLIDKLSVSIKDTKLNRSIANQVDEASL
ncbi:MAG: hypothetical protein K9K32_00130 [Halanaerobiales bacterium]|nr:hypothetical protein [Halanaerobiales bacterium]